MTEDNTENRTAGGIGSLVDNVPKLGFGLMRLPRIDGGNDIDTEQLKEMVDLFLSKGFTYFDTAYGYEGSEAAIAEALVQRHPRESYLLATKLPAWKAKTTADAEQMFWTSLERTGAGYFDYYLLHNLGADRTHTFDDFGIWDFLAKQKQSGLIRHLGFSFHDKASLLDEVLSKHPEVDFVQLQLNYADWENPMVESRKCYETARRHNKPIVIMEPVKGGALTTLPDAAVAVLRKANPKASLASWAIRFAASLDGVITVLSGMSNMDQMRDNVSFMKDFRPLDEQEQEVIVKARIEIEKVPIVPCTSCGYCLPECPQNIAIPGIFEAMNNLLLYGNKRSCSFTYTWNTRLQGKGVASDCIECGACEAVCTQHIAIIEELKRASDMFGE
ncbi:MAG: Fe-S oxidoreductase [Coriobacteriaceae bacterium]|nr:Fe-S oxidoreductase [Coriobacteriaceae bacterium]